MVTFKVFVDRFNGLEQFLLSKVADLAMKHDELIIKLANKQLLEGKNVEGQTMQKGYSKGYSRKRKKKGLQTSFVDLKFTGKYQDSKKLQKADKGVNIVSGVDYEKYLRGNFPKHVGLTKENSETVAQEMEKEVALLIEKYLTK